MAMSSLELSVGREDLSLESSDLQVFISHKHEDAPKAEKLMKLLTHYSGTRVNVFMAEDHIRVGDDYRNVIKQKLADSNLFIFLYTSDDLDYRWCCYEAGIFAYKEDSDNARMICIHSSFIEKPDLPFDNLQFIPSNPERIKKFLKEFYSGDLFPTLGALSASFHRDEGEMELKSQEFSQLFSESDTGPNIHRYNKSIVISVDNEECLKSTDGILDAKVECKGDSIKIFGKEFGINTWDDIKKQASLNKETGWLESLSQSMCKASEGDYNLAIQGKFKSLGECSTAHYQPVLYKMVKHPHGKIDFHVSFHQDISAQLDDFPPSIKILDQSLHMAVRFRCEVINLYYEALNSRRITPNALQVRISKLLTSMEKIESESIARFSQKTLADIFPETRSDIDDMYIEWEDIKDNIFNKFGNQEFEESKPYFDKLSDMNTKFMNMAIDKLKTYFSVMNKCYQSKCDVLDDGLLSTLEGVHQPNCFSSLSRVSD